MRVLIACEYSGIVRDAFRARGHDAWSCDLLPTERPGPHYQGDVIGFLFEGWDLMIAHPPCTHLAVSGAAHFKHKREKQEDALTFVEALFDAPIKYIAIENPVSVISTRLRKPDQVIQPWHFGHREMKTTCLWLENLPPLRPTNIVGPPPPKNHPDRKSWERLHRLGRSPNRGHERSKTFQGIAEAMADQWGSFVEKDRKDDHGS